MVCLRPRCLPKVKRLDNWPGNPLAEHLSGSLSVTEASVVNDIPHGGVSRVSWRSELGLGGAEEVWFDSAHYGDWTSTRSR